MHRAVSWKSPEVLLGVMLLLQLVPLWAFTYFPSQDGPAHLENAALLRDYWKPDRPQLRAFFTLNDKLNPNWTTHLILAGLMHVVPPLVAEKILLSVYLTLLPLAVYYAARGVRPDGGYVALLALPFAANAFLHMGFYNFCFSLVMFFVVLGYWLRHRDALTWKPTLTLMTLVLVLYFCHLVSLLATGLVVLVLTLRRVGADLARARRIIQLGQGLDDDVRTQAIITADLAKARRMGQLGQGLVAAVRTQAIPLGVAFLPAVALAAVFFLGQQVGSGPPPTPQGTSSSAHVPAVTWSGALLGLIEPEALISYQLSEGLITLPLATGFLLFCAVAALRKGLSRRWLPGDDLLLGAAALLLVYFLIPEGATRGPTLVVRLGHLAQHESLTLRLSVFCYFALILWVAAQPLALWTRYALQAGGVLAALLLLAHHARTYQQYQPLLKEYCSCSPYLNSETTLVSVSWNHTGEAPDGRPLSRRIGPFRHAVGYLAAERGLVNLLNYEARAGYFPFVFRPDIATCHEEKGAGLIEDTLRFDFPGYAARSGRPVDGVVLWSLPRDPDKDPRAREILRQLDQGYVRVYQSPGRGLVQLYQRNETPAR